MNKPVIIVGTGGYARVLINVLRLSNYRILGATDMYADKKGQFISGVEIIGDDRVIADHSPSAVSLVNGVGSVRSMECRAKIFKCFKSQGYEFASVIHPTAVVASDAVLCEGIQISAGAVVQTSVHIGVNTIVNTNATIEHDCEIGNHVHVASNVTLCGGVKVGDYTHIGAGATVIQQVQIGANDLVGAGAVVTKSIGNSVTVVGVPAREIAK